MSDPKIDAARKAGYSDSEIADYLAQKNAKIADARKAGYSDGEIISHLTGGTPGDSGSIIQDQLNDAGQNIEGLYNAVRHPLDTAQSVFDTFVAGPASKLAHKTGLIDAVSSTGNPEIDSLTHDIENQKAGFRERNTDAFMKQMGDDFSNPIHTLLHKPVTALMDLSTIAAPMAGLPGRVGQAASMVSRLNPVNLALEGTSAALRPAANYMRTAETAPAGIATRQALSQEFNVPLTQGQIADDASILSREDNLRFGRSGQAPRVMSNFDEGQDAAIANATNNLRQRLTNSPAAMASGDIGDALTQSYQNARDAAQAHVSGLYDRAFDPAELAARGIATDIPIESVYGLKNQIEHSFLHGGSPMVPTDATHPQTTAAVRMLDQFSQTGGIPSAFNKVTVPPAGGQPLVTGIGWQQMDLVRKILSGMRSSARTNPADYAGMSRVLNTFDDQLGRMNPLLNDARAAHSARMDTFEPQTDNAVGVNSFLKTIANENNPGNAIFNKLFNGNAIRSGTAGPMIDQLGQIIGRDPQAVSALREGMLGRLTTNLKTGEAFSPKITANNIRDALQGQSSNAYRQVFSPDELAQLSRYGDLLDHVGTTRAAQNASKTSYNVNPLIEKASGKNVGGTAGSIAGAMIAGPAGAGVGSAVGSMVGGAVDSGISNVLAHRRALQAVSSQYSPPSSAMSSGLNTASNGLQSLAPFSRMLPPGILAILQQQQ